MSINKALFSSEKENWGTPQFLFDELNREFSFEIDLAADENNTKCQKFFSIQDDALKQDWKGVCWLNPPYGRGLKFWYKKALEESRKHGSRIVMLVPARPDTKYFHEYVFNKASEVRFIKGRVKFDGGATGAPFPSMIVVYDSKKFDGVTKFSTMSLRKQGR